MTLPDGPLKQHLVKEHINPLFSKVRAGEAVRKEIYLANHSLGRPLDRMSEDVDIALRMWYSRMERCWEERGWLEEIDLWRANVAKLIGLKRHDSIVPKTSAGQGLRAVLNSFNADRQIKVVTTTGEFDSIDFILRSYEHAGRANVTWVEPSSKEREIETFSAKNVANAITKDTDLVVVSLIFFSTGQILQDIETIINTAHENDAMVLIDLYHAAGVLPLDFEKTGADFAVGGSYKYLRGGPGAAWLAIHPRHLEDSNIRTLDTGWFAKEATFGYERNSEPKLKPGGDAWLESTPTILGIYQAKSGLEFTLDIGVERLREYSLRKQKRMRRAFTEQSVEMYIPDNPENWGAFSLLPCKDAPNKAEALREAGVNCDARRNVLRFCPDIINTDEEFEKAAVIIKNTLSL